ncbi:MAG: hypothetical protein DESF_01992 [Desulfovibrio sp.]
MFKTQKFSDRNEELKKVLNLRRLDEIWMDWVRPGLRSQALFDLHDYYDFQLYRKDKIQKLVNTIFDGTYQPARPNRIRKEKSSGISRHIVVLQPEDALILEAVGQFLYPYVEKNSRSKNVFFSRKHKSNASIEELGIVEDPYGSQAWWALWPQFQEKICGFSRTNIFVVVTDIATYYDSISMQSLRNSVSSTGHFTESFLDFLFFMIDHFLWRPDYIPNSGKGLAQINLEAPRVLAHSYLFDVDSFLLRATSGNFTRWMDDIDFGVDDERTAKKILQDLDEILLSKGLHLNSSKTKILDQKTADDHFYFTENRRITILSNNIDLAFKRKKLYVSKLKKIKDGYYEFKKKKGGNVDKILKRYISLFSKFKCSSLDKDLLCYLINNASIRSSIFRYLQSIGWSDDRQKIIEKYIEEALDDEGLLQAVRVLISWEAPNTTAYRNKMCELARKLSHNVSNDDQCRILCSLWLHCKFSPASKLSKFILKMVPIWKTKPWLARQFVATWPRLNAKDRNLIKNIIYINGLVWARSIVDNFEHIEKPDKFISSNLWPYISAFGSRDSYPLHKALIARAFYQGNVDESKKKAFYREILSKLRDTHIKLLVMAKK